MCVITTILTVGVSCCTGYALAKYDNKWLKAFFLCILATTMLPAEVMLAPLFLVVRNLGLYNSLSGIILPAVLTATGCFMFRQFFLTVPDELVEAARIDGARELSIFLRIMVPLSRPIMLTARHPVLPVAVERLHLAAADAQRPRQVHRADRHPEHRRRAEHQLVGAARRHRSSP